VLIVTTWKYLSVNWSTQFKQRGDIFQSAGLSRAEKPLCSYRTNSKSSAGYRNQGFCWRVVLFSTKLCGILLLREKQSDRTSAFQKNIPSFSTATKYLLLQLGGNRKQEALFKRTALSEWPPFSPDVPSGRVRNYEEEFSPNSQLADFSAEKYHLQLPACNPRHISAMTPKNKKNTMMKEILILIKRLWLSS